MFQHTSCDWLFLKSTNYDNICLKYTDLLATFNLKYYRSTKFKLAEENEALFLAKVIVEVDVEVDEE